LAGKFSGGRLAPAGGRQSKPKIQRRQEDTSVGIYRVSRMVPAAKLCAVGGSGRRSRCQVQGECRSWVIRDRGRVSSKSGYVRSAPKATELLRRHETTRWAKLRHFCEISLASYSITSSARNRNESGSFNPINFAVLRLTVRKNRVGCSIGKSAGLAPLKILSTRAADRRRKSLISSP
jgi:hypothetical protein